jgi:hypothetical protein
LIFELIMVASTFLRTLFFHSPLVSCLVRLILGGIFAAAGGAKLINPPGFAHAISAYGLLPEQLLVPVAIGLPAIELLAGLGLLFNLRGSLTTICALLAVFLFVLGYAIWKNLDVDCGCLSPTEIEAGKSLYKAFLRDLGLMAASFYLMAWRRVRNRSCAQ